MNKSVYLAGPIGGCSYDGATTWRQDFKGVLAMSKIDCYSPLRHKEYLSDQTDIRDHYNDRGLLSGQRQIMGRDFYDCKNCDLLFANFLGTTTISKGTIMEIAWAYAFQKPIVLAMEDGNCHDHAMIREASYFRVYNLKDAMKTIHDILTP